MVDPAWVLALMVKAQPVAPWRNTYDRSSMSIAKAADKYPLFKGADGPQRTAAWMVSLGKYEASLRPDAQGDCTDKNNKSTVSIGGICKQNDKPHSFCMFQIHESNHKSLGVTKEQLLEDTDLCAEMAAKMMQQSFKICSSAPVEERLRQYVAGGDGCNETVDAVKKSKHRAATGIWLFNNVPRESKAKVD